MIPEVSDAGTELQVTGPKGGYSSKDLVGQLESTNGREFEIAVTETLHFLGLHAKHIEVTQGESDVLGEAWYCLKPYAMVIECYAGNPNAEVPQEKVGQVRTAYSRYWTKYRKADAVYRVVIGRPKFSVDCIQSSRASKQEIDPAVDVCLLSSGDLVRLLHVHDRKPLTQADLQRVFGSAGLATPYVEAIERELSRVVGLAAVVGAVLEFRTWNQERKVVAITEMGFAGEVRAYSRMFGVGEFTEGQIGEIIQHLAGPLLGILVRDGNSLYRTNHKFPERISSLGKLGEEIGAKYEDFLGRLKDTKP